MRMKSIKSWFKYWSNISFKLRMARMKIAWKKFKNKFSSKKPSINNTQLKAIEFFVLLLKNKNTTLNHSPTSSARFLELDSIWASMSSSGDHNNYLINIIDESMTIQSHSHEIAIPKEYAFDIMDEFDDELEKKFRAMESIKKRVIIDDLNKLISKINKNK